MKILQIILILHVLNLVKMSQKQLMVRQQKKPAVSLLGQMLRLMERHILRVLLTLQGLKMPMLQIQALHLIVGFRQQLVIIYSEGQLRLLLTTAPLLRLLLLLSPMLVIIMRLRQQVRLMILILLSTRAKKASTTRSFLVQIIILQLIPIPISKSMIFMQTRHLSVQFQMLMVLSRPLPKSAMQQKIRLRMLHLLWYTHRALVMRTTICM